MMTESKIPELLEKLEKLDPDTYEIIRRQKLTWTNRIHFYILMGVILDAIGQYHGFNGIIDRWRYSLLSESNEVYAVTIRSSITGMRMSMRRGSSPGKALLTAYVAALEAEAENAN